MIKHKTLLRHALAALVAAAAAAPVLAQAAVCGGMRVNWNVASVANDIFACGTTPRGSSAGGFMFLPGGQKVASSLSVRLTKGIHASGIGYNAGGGVMPNCNPFDDSTADGSKTVGPQGCLGGAQHQVIVVF